MSVELKPDLCIIGGGAAGVLLALGASARGLSVVLIEKGTLGGYRLTQSVPRNALLAASRAAQQSALGFEISRREPRQADSIDYLRLRNHIQSVIKSIAPNYSQARLEATNVKVIRAMGRFTKPDVCEAGGTKIRARHFVVATGAIERSLPIRGLELIRPLDHASLCALEQPPSSLIVVGTNPDGLALAQAMCRFGCGVTVLSETGIFSSEDAELAAPVRAAFVRDGMAIHEGVRISRVEPRGDVLRVFITAGGHEKLVMGSHILIAAGRAPAVEGMGLAEAKVRYANNGIATGPGLVTSNRRILAIGTVVQGQQYDGAAEQHVLHVLASLLGRSGWRARRQAASRVILTSPPLAFTGLSEAQARAAYRHIHVFRWPFAETERARIENQAGGHVKFLASRKGIILGAGIVGPSAEELINLYTLAISKGMTTADIAAIMTSYPALSEAVRRASLSLSTEGPGPSLMEQALSLLRWFREG